ncbi:MAG: oligogalacturonate lyase family protein [Bryobacterales bacterium]|nr:oligogalacturonate lyase family protein [Bryobacteraceae bacterium]MDW8354159.1 oligogalacturonate lyase family protein [Bryobacterales bacterium]
MSKRVWLCCAMLFPLMAQEPPVEWTDPSTGRRLIRLSTEPGSMSLYFHQNAYTASGDKMVIMTPRGLAVVHFPSRKVELLVPGRVSHVVVGKKTRQVFYIQDGVVRATHLDSGVTRDVVTMPELRTGSGLTVNADETMLAGSYIEGEAPRVAPVPGKSMLEARWEMRLPMALYTVDLSTGRVNSFYRSNDWLNHVQFSPSDPTLLMFCHEGPWHKVDRIWTIRTDGAGLQKMHTRSMEMEIAGHEFWNPDGRIIWYDLQTPRGEEFWLAGVVLGTGEKLRYKLDRDRWSVHYNVSWDGKLFAGDGGSPKMVARAKDGQWIYLFRLGQRVLEWERLVDMSRHDYKLEPNVTFTPDGRWIVFRSNMHGSPHVYAVEVPGSGTARGVF